MILLTKILHFEMAHAIHNYPGDCKNIHGHSYELHITLSSNHDQNDYIPSPGFMIDFKEIKNLVKAAVIDKFDHKLSLSLDFLHDHPYLLTLENLLTWECEPTAENILIRTHHLLHNQLPPGIQLTHLKLYETKDSYAEWKEDIN